MNYITDQHENEPAEPASFEFYFQPTDTLVLVQNGREDVVIRATRETFSERKKENFIHELAMEGFIPDEYRWFRMGGQGIRWVLDRSWLKLNELQNARTRQMVARIILGFGLMGILIVLGFYANGSANAVETRVSRYNPPSQAHAAERQLSSRQ